MIINIIMKNNKCQKCGYAWESKVEEPKCCPSCKQYNWRIPNEVNKDV